MHRGTTKEPAKVWEGVGVRQIDTLPAGTTVTGDAPRSDGYVLLRTPRVGYTKLIWLQNYNLVTVEPPPPPPPPPGDPTLKHVIDIFSDGSILVDGNPIPDPLP